MEQDEQSSYVCSELTKIIVHATYSQMNQRVLSGCQVVTIDCAQSASQIGSPLQSPRINIELVLISIAVAVVDALAYCSLPPSVTLPCSLKPHRCIHDCRELSSGGLDLVPPSVDQEGHCTHY